MKTRDLLSSNESDLTPLLKLMKMKELERHAAKILKKYGQPEYKSVLAAVIKAVPHLEQDKSDNFEDVQKVIKSCLPIAANEVFEGKVLEVLSVIMMMVISKKFREIHTQKNDISGKGQ